MRKRMLSVVLCFALIFSLITISASATEGIDGSIVINSTKTSIEVGDTIDVTFTVNAKTDALGSIDFDVVVPKGLEYVEHNILVLNSDFMLSSYNNNHFGCGMTSAGKNGTFDVLKITFKANGAVTGINNVGVNIDSMCKVDGSTKMDFGTVDSLPINIIVPATNIKLNKTELALESGAEETLSATVVPNNSTDKVSWESDNSDVASVDKSGKVTAHKVGKAVITATAGEATDTCTVTVTCGHKLKANHPAVESTCTAPGHDAYIQCDECGQLFDEKNNEIEEIPSRPLADHKGGTATCKDKAVCSVCNQPYGDYADHNYGDLINEVPADHNNEGMKAHYKCSVCGKFFTESKEETTEEALKIPKVAHEYGDWQSNEGEHWKACGCGNIIDKAPHTGGEATCTSQAICSVCGVKYGELNASNHKHTEVRDAKNETCCEAGYTGDTWCLDCTTKIANGTVIPATGKHVDVDGKWETDGTNHWHTCYFGTKFDITAHSGGEATCHDQAVCEVCGTAYGDLNADNHVYNVVKVTEPTCTAKGYTRHTCEYHSEKYYDDSYTDALGHKVVEWTVTKEATAEESGTKTGKCTVCGEEITAETGKLISKVEGDSAKVEAVGDTTLYENIILKTDKISDKLSDTDKADMQTKIEALKLAVENIKMAEIFDVSLFLRDKDASGNPIQDLKYEPNGKIRITMEVPESVFKNFKNVKLLHFLDDGTVEEVEYTLDGSKAVFETDSLSYFAFAGTPVVTDTGITNDNGTKNENNGQASSPKTGDSSNPIVWIAVLLVSALTVGTVSVYNRKKNCRACKK